MKQRIKHFYEKYEKYLSPGALVAGFVWDNLTLQRIDLWVDNLIILMYLFIACSSIIFLNAHKAQKFKRKIFDRFAGVAPYILQFAFGGLFSVFVVFYSRSASFIKSWPFLIFLLFLLIGNELFQKKYLRLIFQMSIFFVALFSYSIFALPVLVGRMGALVFLASSFLSLLLISIIIFVLRKISPEQIKERRNLLLYTIGGIFVLFNIFYFTNVIPPIPLALKEAGVYHSVLHVGTTYELTYEKPPWYLFYEDFNPKFSWKKGEPVYIFSSVFAPTKLDTKIFHRWSYFDEMESGWVEKDKLGFSIFGGRDGGYRGYTLKYGVGPGDWKVDIITERNQVLGTVKFEVIEVQELPEFDSYKR